MHEVLPHTASPRISLPLTYTGSDEGCGPSTACDLPCCAANFPDIPRPLRRGVRRGCVSTVFASSMAFTVAEKLASPLVPFRGSHVDAAGFPTWYGLPGCTSSSEGYSASPPPVAREQWEPATWLSGDAHDRTFICKLPVPFRAHQQVVRRPSNDPVRNRTLLRPASARARSSWAPLPRASSEKL